MNSIKAWVKEIVVAIMPQKTYIWYLKKRGAIIGNDCEIDKSAFWGTEPWLVRIGNNTRITRNVSFITHDGGIWVLRKTGMVEANSVKIGKISIGVNCNIGWNSIIMPNVKIGNNCVIAAGAVVTKDIPDNEIWGGVPAKRIETIEQYYEKNKDNLFPTFDLNERYTRKLLIE